MYCCFGYGTMKMLCPNCNGKGQVISAMATGGKGTCATCEATGKIPCPECNTIPDSAGEDVEKALKNLDELRQKKLIDDPAFWLRRRQLAYKAKKALEAEAAKEKQKQEESAKEDSAKKQSEPAVADSAKRKEDLKTLLNAMDADAITLETYLGKRNSMGLSEKEIGEIESAMANSAGKAGKYAQLRRRFKDGEIDREAFDKAVSAIK